MSASNNGGPAFPVLHSIDGNWVKEPRDEFCGMTLRDHFAGQAMQALIAGRSWGHLGTDVDVLFKTWATSAYSLADAMLEARKEGGATC